MIRIILLSFLMMNSSYASSWKGYLSQNNIEDFSLCPLFYKMKKWEPYNSHSGNVRWARDQVWKYRSYVEKSGVELNTDPHWLSTAIIKSSDRDLVYVGPWYEATLTYPKQSFLKGLFTFSLGKTFEEPKKIKKVIRLIAWQRGSALWSYFEEKDEENSKIKEMDLDITGPVRDDSMPDLCYIKWTVKHNSYNAKPETIRQLAPGILNKLLFRHEILVTGKVIEVEE